MADLETAPLGDWLLRPLPTSSARRANSVLAMEPSGIPEDYEQVVAFYAGRTGRPIAAVLPGSAEDDPSAGTGGGRERRRGHAVPGDGVAGRRAVRASCRDRPPVAYDEAGDLVTARIGDRASGVAAYADDWVGFRSIDVDPAYPPAGLALAVMDALLEWGCRARRHDGVPGAGRQRPAIALYEGLGF